MYQTKTEKSGQIQKNVQKQILFPDFPDLSVCCSFLSGVCSSLLKFSLGGRAITFTSALNRPTDQPTDRPTDKLKYSVVN